MLNPLDIYRKDLRTRSHSRSHVLIRRIFVGSSVCALAFFFNNLTIDFLASVLAVQSILAGFGFNVLVYLSTNRQIAISSSAKIERRLKINRVNALGREIFFNISYFNTLAIICIAVSLFLAALHSFSAGELIKQNLLVYHPAWLGKGSVSAIKVVLSVVGAMVLYLLVIQSILTFMRLIARSTYYFEQKIALSEGVTDVPVEP